MSNISRRDFLKMAAAGAVSASVMTAGLSSAMAEDAVPAYLPEKWDYEADVVICGYGMAGAAAAREAIAEGVSCLVLEKGDEFMAGGSATASAGAYFGNDTATLVRDSRGYVSEETIVKVLEEGSRIQQWMTEKGMDYSQQGASVYASVKAAVDGCGAHVLYETPAKKLVFDPATKEVFGVIAQDKDGNEVTVKANKGVLLATGGFLANKELVHRFLVPKEVDVADVGAATCTGDGLMMAMEVNAALKNLTWQCLENYGQGSVAIKAGSDELGVGLLHYPTGEGRGARIIVNTTGNRFMDEDAWYCHTKGNNPAFQYAGMWMAYQGWANLPMYLIFDSTLMDGGCIGPVGAGLGWAKAKNIYEWSPNNQAELEKGWIVKGDTIEELVEKLAEKTGKAPIDAEGLKAQIERYNGYCEAGADPEFYRAAYQIFLGPSTLEPINNPPYYACELTPAYIYTIGGLHWGEDGSTLDWNGEAIPGLYHAGDVGQFTEVTVMGLRDCMAAGSYTCRTICAKESRTIPGEAAVVIAPSTAEEQALADITGYTPTVV